MVLQGAFILPHGSIILDPMKENLEESVKKLHQEMITIGQEIANLNPDFCILITPHGISLSYDYGFYLNNTAKGSAEWEGEYEEFQIAVNIAQDQTKTLLNNLKVKKIPVSGITCYTSDVSAPLRWGEVVPLWFLREIYPEYIICSLPSRRYSQVKTMIPELLQLGKEIQMFIQSLDQKVILLISADLAHTYSEEGPYGISAEAEKFDKLIEQWISKGMEKSVLLEQSSAILDKALACGFAGCVILQGALEGLNFTPKIRIRAHPTYYGMLVASFL
jgi:aromatic ring-opening dioxygenase LigB subunit